MREKVVCTWSGGIDSTAVLGQLLKRPFDIHVISFSLPYGVCFASRELGARRRLKIPLATAENHGEGRIVRYTETRCDWLEAFRDDTDEIRTRNKRIIDHLVAKYGLDLDVKNIAMGEYIGADTWVVQDHVDGRDCDHRSLTSYLFQEYGLEYRLISLADFGPCRYKHERIRIGFEALGAAMFLTTNCLENSLTDCGSCYKCVERAAAFVVLKQHDPTPYRVQPAAQPSFETYVEQMGGR
jgi:hypothetical protein